ncbi:MAG TPA: hypothetical protein VKA68_15920, partial [bacterium]|nr:hypothetical protein [bacterium]
FQPIPNNWLSAPPPDDTDWERAANWSLGTVLGSIDSVAIPASSSNGTGFPDIDASTPTIQKLEIEPGASVDVLTGQPLTIQDDLSGTGDITVDNATLTVNRDILNSPTITGVTTADSEVELYRNNRLIDYTTATENGEYSFTFPLTYGSSQISLKIYGPTGEVEEVSRRIQIPFTFLPKGSVYYHVNAGRLDNLYKPWHLRRFRSNASVSVGATNWFTGTLGANYIQEENGEIPYFYSSLSARILTQYLINLDLIPDAFYRITGSVVYPSSTSWRLVFTHYTNQGLFNPAGLTQKLSANMFIPFRVFQIPVTTHAVLDAQRYADENIWMRHRTQFSIKLRRLRLRFGYRGTVTSHTTQTTFLDDYLTASAMFTVPRKSYFPRILHNASLTAELEYSENFESLENLQIHFSKAVFRSGYFRLTYERNLLQDASMIEATFSLDLGKTRSTSTVRKVRDEPAYAQNFRGTIGFDSHQDKVFFHDRQQVGRAASTIRLFVDENNSGGYDEGERVLNEQAVRIVDAPMRAKNHKNGIRFMQLEPYRRYNLEINKSAIREPMLVPEFDQFAIRTDPNACKPIDIPFYLTGIIDGKVMRQSAQGLKPVAGLRVLLKSKDGKFEKTVKTFADGSFYAMEIPPGEYEMEIDENQLAFLDTDPYPTEQTFTVEPNAEGDMIDGLNFALVERGTETIPPEIAPFLAGVEETRPGQIATLPDADSKPAPSGEYAGEVAAMSSDTLGRSTDQVETAPQIADAEESPDTGSGALSEAETETSAGSESDQVAALHETATTDSL